MTLPRAIASLAAAAVLVPTMAAAQAPASDLTRRVEQLEASKTALEKDVQSLRAMVERLAPSSGSVEDMDGHRVPASDMVLGAATAPVTIIEFADFQCPFCAQFTRDTFPAVRAQLIDSGKVRFVFRHLPLTNLHPLAVPAAQAAECARDQGHFWEMHDFLFSIQDHFEPAAVVARAEALGIPRDRFLTCVTDHLAEQLKTDSLQATIEAIRGTPTFIIGHTRSDGSMDAKIRVSGPQPFDVFQALVERVASADHPR